MDPVLGRFVSEDPARDGANWLVYCRNNPTNLGDTTGRSANLIQMAFLTIVISAVIAFIWGFLMSVKNDYVAGNPIDYQKAITAGAEAAGGLVVTELALMALVVPGSAKIGLVLFAVSLVVMAAVALGLAVLMEDSTGRPGDPFPVPWRM
jgi:hypothetical protein